MAKALGITLVALLAIVALAFGGRAYATRAMLNRAVTPKPLAAATPASAGLPFSRVAVENGDRTLIGWWVRARADSGKVAPAVLFLHGNRSSISDYIPLQRFLYRQGISSLVFDYSGFGASGGSASLRNAVADAGTVAKVFADSAGKGARRIAMGSALGSTVLLQAIDSVQPHVNGVIIEGVAASVRESAVRDGRIPSLIAPLVVDVGDNVAAARNVRVPLLAVHSYADNRFPFEDAQRVVASVPSQSSLVRHWRKGHSALLSSTKACDWEPVLAFVRAGTLPRAKVDSTDVCAAQLAAAAAAAAAKASAAASKASVTPAGRAVAPAGTSTKTGATKAGATKTKARPTRTAKP
jgi:uncharacterized protein